MIYVLGGKGSFWHFKGYLKCFFFHRIGLVKGLAGAAMLWEQTIRFGIEEQKPKTDKRKRWQSQLESFGKENKNSNAVPGETQT